MVEAPFVIAEIAVTIIKAIADLCGTVIGASVGGWRYLLSSTYRNEVDRRLETRSALYRTSVYLAGALVVAASVPAIVVVGWLVWRLLS